MNKKNRISNILIIIVFISTLTLPQFIFWIIEPDIQEISETENRTLNSKPEFKLSTISEYPKKFEDYYNDYLPFREDLRGIWSDINFDIFHTTVDEKVLIGKDGWLFFRGNTSIEQVQGIAEYTEEDKRNILNGLQNNENKLKNKNIEMYVLILPNKENVYKEKLPTSIPIKNNISRTEQLIDYIKNNSDINIVYPKTELLKVKEKHQIYKKYDTHWNRIGALVGAVSLQKAIDEKYVYDLENITIEKNNTKETRDLATMANLQDKVFEKSIIVNDFYPNIEYEVKNRDYYQEFTSNSTNDKTLLFVGDSFSEALKVYLPKLYKRVIFVHRVNYNEELLDTIKPDIVVTEAVERFSELFSDGYIL